MRLVASAEQAIAAVDDALTEGKRLVVSSGGQCLEGFVSDPEVRVLLDVSPMKYVHFDAESSCVIRPAVACVQASTSFVSASETEGFSGR